MLHVQVPLHDVVAFGIGLDVREAQAVSAAALTAQIAESPVGNSPGARLFSAPFSVNGAALVANWPIR